MSENQIGFKPRKNTSIWIILNTMMYVYIDFKALDHKWEDALLEVRVV